MKRIRTKLVLALLIIALLPVYPIYFLAKNLLQQSLQVGYNENVEMALQQAAEITRELYAKYKDETLTSAKELARARRAALLYEKKNDSKTAEKMGAQQRGKIDFFDLEGNLIQTTSDSANHSYPMLYQNIIVPLAEKHEAKILDVSDDTRHIIAFAPVFKQGSRVGSLVFTRIVDEQIVQGAQKVIEVNQMFKTLDFLFEDDLSNRFILAFFAIYLPIALFSVALGIYFSRKITSPLLHLVDGTKRVAAGDWSHRVEVTSKDEIGEVVESFNQMVSTLKEKQNQVVALEKIAVWREIARVLAHEIKNPLTPIQLTVQQLKDKYSGEDQEYKKLVEECTDIVNDEIESLRTLVREFSEFARMPEPNITQGDLNELIAEVGKIYPNKLELQLDASLPATNFDYEQLRRVLINLIDNGLHSIQEKGAGEILLKTYVENEKVGIEYKDTGNGMSGEVREKIFEPYFSTKKSGMGLGLAIVKRIIEEHGGTISVESEEGKGTGFIIELPI